MRKDLGSAGKLGAMAAMLGFTAMAGGCATTAPETGTPGAVATPVAVAPPIVRVDPSPDRLAVLAQIERKERRDEFDQMIIQTDIDGDRLVAFMQAAEKRAADLAAYEADPEKGTAAQAALAERIKTAEAAGDTDQVAALQEQAGALHTAYWTYRTRLRADVMGGLSPAQQTAWVAHHLSGRVARALRAAQLTEEQKVQVQAITVSVAADTVARGIVDSDPYLRSLGGEPTEAAVAEARKSVLTPEQVAALGTP